jgi:5'-methylthioadenosine phosphorylase
MDKAEIGIFGGSGFYKFLENVQEIKVDTPYGAPSDKVALGTLAGRRVAFLPRHGKEHSLPPHMINFRANVWAMKEIGVTRVIGPCSCGSLQPEIKPGDFVFCDQFVDRTSGRKDTFYDGPITTHTPMAEPYCTEMRKVSIEAAKKIGLSIHETGTIVTIQGPRFSTKAESRWFTKMGWDVVTMTQYPEAPLAKEIGLCYVNVSLVTDYDAGLEGRPDIKAVTHDQVIKVFNENVGKLKSLLHAIVESMPEKRNCDCEATFINSRTH